jgi:hypothetical protein
MIRCPYLEGIVRAVPSLALEKECPGASAELISTTSPKGGNPAVLGHHISLPQSTTSPKGGNPAVLGHHISLPQIIFQQQRATAEAAADGPAPKGRPRSRALKG